MSTITRFRATTVPFDLNLSWLLGPDIRIEEKIDGDRYIVRAEVPGLDPARDVRVSVAGGDLRLRVERKEEPAEKGHTEFRYGTFHRSIPLPASARTDTLSATYRDGILEVSALIGEPEAAAKTIPITVGKTDRT